MKEKFVLSEHCIPDGILQDQILYDIKLENRELTLSFKIHYCAEDYIDTGFAEKYKGFTKCQIKCILKEGEADNAFKAELTTALDNENVFKTKVITLFELVEVANKAIEKSRFEYLGTDISPNIRGAIVDLMICLEYNGTLYSSCKLQLYTDEIEYIWE